MLADQVWQVQGQVYVQLKPVCVYIDQPLAIASESDLASRWLVQVKSGKGKAKSRFAPAGEDADEDYESDLPISRECLAACCLLVGPQSLIRCWGLIFTAAACFMQ